MTAPRYWADALQVLSADPSFMPRPSQTRVVELLHDGFAARRHTAIEAPVGTGKSIAALMVAEHASYRTVISTATRALQDQLQHKDVPYLQEAGLLDGDVVVLQGRNRYMCGNRARIEAGTGSPASRPYVKRLLRADPVGGLRDALPTVPDWVWEKVCSDADACRALQCTAAGCEYTRIRDLARSTRIVVVNHHVLLADAAIKGGSGLAWGKRSKGPDDRDVPGVLGPYRNLIVDEGHALEAAAESFGERRVSVRGVMALATRIGRIPGNGARNHLAECKVELEAGLRRLPKGSLIEPMGRPVFPAAARAAKAAGSAVRGGGTFEEEMRREVLAQACFSLADRLAAIDEALVSGEDSLGPRAPSADDGAVVSQLVDAGGWLRGNLFDHVPTALLSGTLSVPGRRDYVTERIGLGVPVVALPTVFDLRSQRLVYVTPRADSGGGARVGDADAAELLGLLEASRGRALVLFPAVQDLRFMHDRLSGAGLGADGEDVQVLAQGVTSEKVGRDVVPVGNGELARRFREDRHSVLLATRSFFEGVDFPGETCSLVVIARFPNLRPDDPLTLARRRAIERSGGNAWSAYQEPAMQLLFKQAAGRAIRRVDDRGVVAVLDPRSGSKQYARRALMSMVPSGFTDDVGDVRVFLQ